MGWFSYGPHASIIQYGVPSAELNSHVSVIFTTISLIRWNFFRACRYSSTELNWTVGNLQKRHFAMQDEANTATPLLQ